MRRAKAEEYLPQTGNCGSCAHDRTKIEATKNNCAVQTARKGEKSGPDTEREGESRDVSHINGGRAERICAHQGRREDERLTSRLASQC